MQRIKGFTMSPCRHVTMSYLYDSLEEKILTCLVTQGLARSKKKIRTFIIAGLWIQIQIQLLFKFGSRSSFKKL